VEGQVKKATVEEVSVGGGVWMFEVMDTGFQKAGKTISPMRFGDAPGLEVQNMRRRGVHRVRRRWLEKGGAREENTMLRLTFELPGLWRSSVRRLDVGRAPGAGVHPTE
jgi:hypothetical protein